MAKRCIFCKADASRSKSMEHIIPESLGNTEHVLPPGIVCDSCNNYLAREVEKPVLDSEYFTRIRLDMSVVNKRGLLPNVQWIHVESATILEFDPNVDGGAFYPRSERDGERYVTRMLSGKKNTFVQIAEPYLPDSYPFSRFLGKIALEALAQRALSNIQFLNEIIDKEDLNLLRNFVRRGEHKQEAWPVNYRQIYPASKKFYEAGYGHFEVLHEYQFLYPKSQELYFVLALFGTEYVMNMGTREIESYQMWLKEHDDKSPLYP